MEPAGRNTGAGKTVEVIEAQDLDPESSDGASRPGSPPAKTWDSVLISGELSENEVARASNFPRANAHNRPSFAGIDDAGLFSLLTPEFQKRLVDYRRELAAQEPGQGRYVCWAPDTAPEVVEAFRRVERDSGLSAGEVRALAFRYLGGGHWSRTATNGSGNNVQGLPITLTWSIVPDGTQAPGESGSSTSGSNLRSWAASLYGGSGSGAPSSQPWFSVFQNAMDQLSAQSGLKLVYEPTDDGIALSSGNTGILGVRGDIRISGRNIDGNSNTLAFAFAPDYGDLVLDTADSYFNNLTNSSIRLGNTFAHEVGHALGLDHVCPINESKLMEPYITTDFRGPQFDEMISLQRQYGDGSEASSPGRNNDSAATATPLNPAEGINDVKDALSIDDNADVDYFSFSANSNQRVTISVIPTAVGAYSESSQRADGTCAASTTFDPRNRQNLSLELLGSDGATVVASTNAQPAGVAETLAQVRLPATGTFFIRVRGGTGDTAQIYRLETLVANSPPAPEMRIDAAVMAAGSSSGLNGAPDAGETIHYAVTLRNYGELTANDLSATLTGPHETTIVESGANYGNLAPGEAATREFVFVPQGVAGQTLPFTLSLTASGGYNAQVSFGVTLGGITPSIPLNETFDASAALPAGWVRTTKGKGKPWKITSKRALSKPRSMFAAGAKSAGESILISPTVPIGPRGGLLTFHHRYDLEDRWDGAILEASLNGGAWFDLLNSAAGVAAGNYNKRMRSNINTALASRTAWTGSAKSFTTTQVQLPAAWALGSVQFRWRLVHDGYGAKKGWSVDNVVYSTDTPVSEPAPAATLTADAALPATVKNLAAPSPGYADWISPVFEAGNALAAAEADPDRDGWANIGEYLFGTDPLLASSFPVVLTVVNATNLELRIPPPIPRPDAAISAETSADLDDWTSGGVTALPLGFSVPRDAPSRYLRLKFVQTP